MAAPLKPWERPGTNYQQSTPLPPNSMASNPFDRDQLGSIGGTASPVSPLTSPPQLPPRPSQQSSYQSRLNSGLGYGAGAYGGGGYSSYSSPYGLGGYGGGGLYSSPYSSYGGYGQGRFNDVNNPSSFARHAEESSRPAFESIESIVHAVTSVGMMLDSTFQAVYNSFRAVIGVADNFSRLKSQLVQVFSALAFIRTLRYFYRRILEMLKLKNPGEAEREWRKAFQKAAEAAAASSPDGAPKRSSWPILLFFGIIMGGPYLIWKLISKFSDKADEKGWATGSEDHFVGQALHSFQGQGMEEISFSKGQYIKIAPKEMQPRVRGWLLASVDGSKVGMVPANYLKVLGKKKGTLPNSQEQQGPSQSNTDSNLQLASASTNKQPSKVNTDDFESAFTSDGMPLNRDDNFSAELEKESEGNRDAADILSEAEKS